MSSSEVLAVHDGHNHTFTVNLVGGVSGLLRYQWREQGRQGQPRVMRLMHTFVPEQLRGQAQGGVLMEAVLRDIAAMGVLVEPVCSYTQVYMRRHASRWGHLLEA